MATSFTITNVDFVNTPASAQTWTFQYKLFSDPDSAYVLMSNSASIAPNGTLAVPLVVSGLTAGQLYYVLAYNNCDSPAVNFIQQIQL